MLLWSKANFYTESSTLSNSIIWRKWPVHRHKFQMSTFVHIVSSWKLLIKNYYYFFPINLIPSRKIKWLNLAIRRNTRTFFFFTMLLPLVQNWVYIVCSTRLYIASWSTINSKNQLYIIGHISTNHRYITTNHQMMGCCLNYLTFKQT